MSGHSHDPTASGSDVVPPAGRRRLALAMALSGLYMVAEAVGGWLTGSLALLADSGHMLSDVAALGLALFALRMAERPPTRSHTYGFHRMEILAALTNGVVLAVLAVLIAIEAVARLRSPTVVEAPLMMMIALGGLAVNGVALLVLHGGRGESLNLRGAWLHVLMDTLGSVQALTAGALIALFGWSWADPVASIAIAVLVVVSAGSMLRETLAVLMERAPSHIDVGDVRGSLLEEPGVVGVHDLHVWTITSGFVALSAHVVAPEPRPLGGLLDRLRERLRTGFGIEHVTLQIEPEEHDACRACSEEPRQRRT